MIDFLASIDWALVSWCIASVWVNLCCCVETGCLIGQDNFNRADEDPPSGWTEVVGTEWKIVSNELQVDSDNAALRFNTAHPDGIASCVVNASVFGPNEGDELRVIVNYTDSNNYDFAQLKVGDTACLSLWSRVAGVNTMLSAKVVDALHNEWHFLTVYFGPTAADSGLLDPEGASNEDVFAVTMLDPFFKKVTYVKTGTGQYTGLGTGAIGASPVKFDDFMMSKHYHPTVGDATTCERTSFTCEYFRDDFDRDDLGCAFTVPAGSAAIASGKLTTSTSGTIVLSEAIHPRAIANTTLNVTGIKTTSAEGTLVKFILGYVDANNYVFAEVRVGDFFGNFYHAKIYRRVGGVNTLLVQSVKFINGAVHSGPTANWNASFCWTSNTLTLEITGDTFSYIGLTAPGTKCRAGIGIGSGATGTVSFDAINLHRSQSALDLGCSSCRLECESCLDQFMPPYLIAEVDGFTEMVPSDCGECSLANATYVVPATSRCNYRTETAQAICEGLFGFPTGVLFFGIGYDMFSSRWSAGYDSENQVATQWRAVQAPVDCDNFEAVTWTKVSFWNSNTESFDCNDAFATLQVFSP